MIWWGSNHEIVKIEEKPVEIAKKLEVVKSYVTKIIQKDERLS